MTETKFAATLDAYGDEILALGLENPDIFVIDCDISKSCKTAPFAESLPKQHINAGIAEQNACGMAAGLALCGKTPFVTTYAVFGSMRMCEQIRQSVCLPCLNVKIACSHGGLTAGNDGASHQGVEDMGVLRALPNMTIVMGCDYYSTRKLVRALASYKGPAYLRLTRDPVNRVYEAGAEFVIGKANILKKGGDVAVIATGDGAQIAIEAADILYAKGFNATVVDMHTIKPIDAELIKTLLKTIGKIVTVEDHSIINGLGSAVAEVVSENGGIMRRIGIRDRYGESAPYDRLLSMHGITPAKVADACIELITLS